MARSHFLRLPLRRTAASAAIVAIGCVLAGSLLFQGVAYAQPTYAPQPPPTYPPLPPAYAPPPPVIYGPYRYPRYEYVVSEEPRSTLDLGIDFEGAAPVSIPRLPDGNRIESGSGFKLRIGDKLYVAPGVHLTPEIGYAYDRFFAINDFTGGWAYDWNTSRLQAGLRIEFGRLVVPSIYGHLGAGWRWSGDPTLSLSAGFAGDVGAALDLRLWRHFQLGGFVEYAAIDVTPAAPQWCGIGIHGDVLC
ncbi:MAG TPA: hypothetical protein VEK07_03465 [Polyangiaceae bacterium]|nr:hypothetical protein [Polyangiaceae bacterium]